jgi:hypothetical protein
MVPVKAGGRLSSETVTSCTGRTPGEPAGKGSIHHIPEDGILQGYVCLCPFLLYAVYLTR